MKVYTLEIAQEDFDVYEPDSMTTSWVLGGVFLTVERAIEDFCVQYTFDTGGKITFEDAANNEGYWFVIKEWEIA